MAKAFPDRINVVGLAARRDLRTLAEQIREFRPAMVAHGNGYELPHGEGLGSAKAATVEEIVSGEDVDTVVVASTGARALDSILRAIRHGKTVVLGNKEAVIMAGPLLTYEAAQHDAKLIPMDSETTAVWQCMMEEAEPPNRLIIPSRFGPVLAGELGHMARISPETFTTRERRPLGRKRAIDASTLMNKAMQVAEVHYLFNIPLDRIAVLFHPQDRIRALLELRDGTMKAVMAHSDPRVVIQVALAFPERWENADLPGLTAADLTELAFLPLEEDQFPCFSLALDAVKKGGTYPAALNAANETAVSLFLYQQIGFQEIPRVIERTLATHRPVFDPTYDAIIAADKWAREFASAQTAS
ncbi:MAG: 1-deoxy-D-xylulose-5-phosphate reductoisomerase [Chloroflexi bacterium]|jgi:1-deoxy-D-xylulose-5-phosphate reductoisomerase|nr:MAG: 1-deoxy-D-xylulose-5-phosphate reductoisomerase [Chloroflexota bacterium]